MSGTPPKLDHDALVAAQQVTLAAPKRRYSLGARVLFAGMDVVYGTKRTLSKFKVLELIARVPYQTWEQVAYVAVTHTHRHTDLARRIHERILDARGQQAIAYAYYQWSWILYVEHPEWENEPFESVFCLDYGQYDSLADVFRQIGHDERFHKQESLDLIHRARFR